jgi:hypothetical protein
MWQIDPGTLNNYKCRRIQVPQEMWITAFRSLSPVGTHHQVLTIDNQDTYVGDMDCSVTTGTLGGEMLYASGVNTDDLQFPSGVAIHLAAGTWINLNLHLFDAGDQPISGESGLYVKTVPQSEVVNPADMEFSGTTQLTIPNDGQVHTAGGGCLAPHDLHVFALWPHMHQIAVHQKVTVTPSGGSPATWLDTDYSFNEQKNYPMAEMVAHQGDRIQTTCSYVNTGSGTVYFGDSSLDEMCFTGIYKYPAGGSLLACVDK